MNYPKIPTIRSRRQSTKKNWSYWLVLLVIFGLSIAWYNESLNQAVDSKNQKDIQFIVESGTPTLEIVKNLSEKDLIKSSTALKIHLKLSGKATEIKAGNYHLRQSLSSLEIIDLLMKGSDPEVSITIPEGWQIKEMAQYFENLGLLFTADEFVEDAVMQVDFSVYGFLDLSVGESLEGYLFPDTYKIFYDSSPEDIIIKMLNNFNTKIVKGLKEDIASNEMNLHDIMTFASIIQEESPSHDMAKIAGVFWNRLQDNYPLQSDATVNYVLGTSNLQPSFEDTDVDNPYNTYEYNGLPPGPIGNPGIAAIKAALSPANHNYYFFLSKPSGETVFSVSFEEHLKNKALYLD